MLSLKEAALDYAERGWAVFPLHNPLPNGSCSCRTQCGKSAGKHPRTTHGLHDATTDAAQIDQWWSMWPEANIGVRTGRASGIWVLDLDNKESVELASGEIIPAWENSLRSLGEVVPDTFLVSTGSGGFHAYFTLPDDGVEHPNFQGVLPGVDGRGDGGYVVAPPSLHLSGHRYTVAEDRAPAEMPGWIEQVHARQSEERDPISLHEFKEGERNNSLFRLAARLRGSSALLGRDELFGILTVYNKLYCRPPLETRDLLAIAESAAQFEGEPEKPKLDSTGWTIEPGADLAESLWEMSLEPPEVPPFLVDRLLRQGERMVVAAQPNTGKSWVLFDLALSVLDGQDWMGEFAISDPGGVLYIDLESTRWAVWRRMQMLMEGRGTSATQYKDLRIVTGRRLRLDDDTGHATIARLLDRYRPRLCIIDSLVRIHRGLETSATEMAAVFERVDRLRDAYGVAFAFAHHVRKPQAEDVGDAGDLMRGSSEIRAYPDVGLTMKPGAESDQIEVWHFKQREGGRLDPFTARVRIDDEAQEARIEYLGAIEQADPRMRGNRGKVLGVIRLGAATSGDVAAVLGISEKTARDHLRALVGAGSATQQVSPGEPTRYSAVKEGT